MNNLKTSLKMWTKHLFTLGLVSQVLSLSAFAEFGSLACYNVSDRWTQAANQFLLGIENRVNDQVDQYVSLLNFDLGNTNFGVQGNADIGQLKTPPFSCSNPKAILKSGIADLGINPRYVISARIFGLPISVVDARMQGGQGPNANVNRSADANTKLKISVKVIGIDVLNRERRGPEVETNNVPVQTTSLPAQERMGTGGKLFDITRSLSDSLGGTAPRIDIIAPFLYVQFDAGFFLQSDLIFTYGVESSLANFSGSANFGQIKTALMKNPANNGENYCEADVGTSGSCTPRSSLLTRKAKDFYQSIKNSTNLDDQVLALRQSVRDLNTARLTSDARATKAALSADWTRLTNNSMSSTDRKTLIETYQIDKVIKPLQSPGGKIMGLYAQAKGIQNSAVHSLNQIAAVSSAFDSGFPEVKANTGVGLSGKAGAWANAMLVVDAEIAKAWAGVQGNFTLIDLRAGLNASLNTKSQYLDLTVSLQQVRMQGSLDLVYGVKLGIDPLSTNYNGTKNIVSWPGTSTSQEWLAGRVDFKPAGKSPLFWCWNLFGSASVDQDRCADGIISKSQNADALAADNELNLNMANDPNLDDTANCFVSNSSGRTIATSSLSGQACASVLPPSSDTKLGGSGQNYPGLALRFKSNPELFVTNLRDDFQRPALVFNYNSVDNVSGSRTYYARKSVGLPYVGRGDVYAVNLSSLTSPDLEASTAALQEKIFTYPFQNVSVTRTGQATARAQHEDADLKINMSWAKTRWPDFSAANFFIGDLPSLPNDLLVEMGKTYRLGRCSAVQTAGELFLDVAGKPYPANGDPTGSASVNSRATNLDCAIGNTPDPSHFSNPANAYAACALRAALQAGECFPAARAVDLVKLANLSDEDALRGFLGINGTKTITGDVVANGRQRDLSYEARVQIDENTNVSDSAISLFSTFFNGTGYGIYPYHDADSKRCNIPYVNQGGLDYDHWFERLYHSNGTSSSTQELVIHSRRSSACYAIKSSSSAQSNYAVGSASCSTNAFKANYNYEPASRGKANPTLCDAGNPSHRDQFATAAIPTLKASSTYGSATGTELVSAVKRCLAGDVDPCVYSPNTSVLPAQDGGPVGNPLALANCSMRVSYAANFFDVSSPNQTNSLESCVQQSGTPSFSDAQNFCQSSAVKANLTSLASTALSSSGGTGTVSLGLTVNRATTPAESRYVGSCTVVMSANQITNVYGQTVNPLNSPLASQSTTGCDMRARKNSSAGKSYFVTAAAPDDLVSPSASATNCWRALGFVGDSTDLTKANEVCSALGSDAVIGLFGSNADLITGAETLSKTGTAELFSERNSAIDRVQACNVTKTVKQWRDILANGRCNLQISPLVYGGQLPQTLSLPVNGGGTSSCSLAATQFSGTGCKKLCAMPQYLPFSTSGANISVAYGTDTLSSPSPWSCSCGFNPNGDAPTNNDNSCLASGAIKFPGGQLDTQSFFSAPLKSNDSASTSASTCLNAWSLKAFNSVHVPSMTFCASITSKVEDRLAASGQTQGQVVDSAGRKVWTNLINPLAGVSTAKLSTTYTTSSPLALGECQYQFVANNAANSGQVNTWRLEPVSASLPTTDLASAAKAYREKFLQNTRSGHSATLLKDGRVLFAGGTSLHSSFTQADSEIYDPQTKKFSRVGKLNFARAFHTAVLLNDGRVLISGGLSYGVGSTLKSELFNPTTGTFSTSLSTLSSRKDHTATLLSNGKVAFIGGSTSSGLTGSIEIYDPATDNAYVIGNINLPRAGHTASLLPGDKILIAGGTNNQYTANGFFASAEMVDGVTGVSATIASMKSARTSHTATTLQNGWILIAGGYALGGFPANSEVFIPSNQTFNRTGSLSVSRYNHTATLMNNGKVLIAGGTLASGGPADSVEIFDPANTSFTPFTSPLYEARYQHSATLLPSGLVLIAGGRQTYATLDTVESFDANQMRLTALDNVRARASSRAATALASGNVLIVGGGARFNGEAIAAADIYDASTGQFKPTGSLNLPRTDFAVAPLLDGGALVVGGLSAATDSSKSEIYNSQTGTFRISASLREARISLTATALADGRVFVMGGYGQVTNLLTTELYDPKTDKFVPGPNLDTNRAYHTATRLLDGRVLIAGGSLGSSGITSRLDTFDPNSGIFSSFGNLQVARSKHFATLLPDGKVFVIGGWNGSNNLISAEIVDPASRASTSAGNLRKITKVGSATLLQNGKVAVVGTTVTASDGTTTTGVEIFDPSTKTFVDGITLYDSFSDHNATALPNGQVLLSDGTLTGQGFGEIIPANGISTPSTSQSTQTAWLVIGHESDYLITAPNSTLRYGANGNYITKVTSGEIHATNDFFENDPAPGAYKTVELKIPLSWIRLGYEGSSTTVPNNTVLRYGANGSYVTGTFSGTVVIGNASFGSDPAPGLRKECLKVSAGTNWVHEGFEYDTLDLPENTVVRFGASSGGYIYRIVSGSFIANTAFFGGDPANGARKEIDVLQ